MQRRRWLQPERRKCGYSHSRPEKHSGMVSVNSTVTEAHTRELGQSFWYSQVYWCPQLLGGRGEPETTNIPGEKVATLLVEVS
jgi:hypothetical protein